MRKIGIIGAFDEIEKYLIEIKKVSDIKLQGVCFSDQNLEEKVEDWTYCNVYDSFDLLIKEIDILFIVSTISEEFEISKKALSEAKHVFTVHPITITADQALKLLGIAIEKETYINFSLNTKYDPTYLTVEPHIKDPSFMEVHNLLQFPYATNDNSVIMELLIQDVDIVLRHVNSKVNRISANGVSVISDDLDMATVRIEFEDKRVANFTSSRVSMKKLHKIRFFQQDTYISIAFDSSEVEVVKISDYNKEEEDPFAMVVDVGKNKGFKKFSFDKPETKQINTFEFEVNELLNAIQKKDVLDNKLNHLSNTLNVIKYIDDAINN
jgi:predicted dehydrogenase